MSVIRVATPLRPFTDGQKEIEVTSRNVAEAMAELVGRYPGLKPHLYDASGDLRPFVNLFLNEDDVRTLQGQETALSEGDRLMIVPSIAGGGDEASGADVPTKVDHAALRTNQALIIALLLAGFIADAPGLVLLVALVMALGALLGRPGFAPIYRLLRSVHILKPDVLPDNPQPHRFAQGLGAVVLLGSLGAFVGKIDLVGWGLAWVVIALAGLNLFGGYCLGCAVYYWLNRIGLPGFTQTPPAGTPPGKRAG